MGFCSALTLVLIVLKLIGVITWSWFFCIITCNIGWVILSILCNMCNNNI